MKSGAPISGGCPHIEYPQICRKLHWHTVLCPAFQSGTNESIIVSAASLESSTYGVRLCDARHGSPVRAGLVLLVNGLFESFLQRKSKGSHQAGLFVLSCSLGTPHHATTAQQAAGQASCVSELAGSTCRPRRGDQIADSSAAAWSCRRSCPRGLHDAPGGQPQPPHHARFLCNLSNGQRLLKVKPQYTS